LSNTEANQQIRALLGDDAYARLTGIQRTQNAFGIATDVAVVLNSSIAPLTSQQTQELEQIFISASPDYQSGKALNASNLDWDAIVDQATSILSLAQVEAVKALKARQTAEDEEDAYRQVLDATVNGTP
jgi:hypothetical protein